MSELHEDPKNPQALVIYCNSLLPTMHVQYATLHSLTPVTPIHEAFNLGICCEANLNIGDYHLDSCNVPDSYENPNQPMVCQYCHKINHNAEECCKKKRDCEQQQALQL